MKHNFKFYCKDYENIENYEKAKADNFVGWCVHHRLQTWTSDGERRLVSISAAELIALDMYYDRPASELIFLPASEHNSLHMEGEYNPMCSKEARKKISKAMKGRHLTEEHKKKLSEINKGKYIGEKHPMYGKHHSEEARKKISEAQKGYHWYNDGKINKRAYECPDGFVPGRLI